MAVLVGTCGFSYKEWVGVVYPEGTSQGRMLEVYSRMFPAVEIDSTYYRLPQRTMFRRYPQRTGGKLKVVVKLNSRFTHERDAGNDEARAFFEAVKPLEDSGQFACFLAQFPQSFRATEESAAYLDKLRGLLAGRTVVCEFRHADWWSEEAVDWLRRLGMPMCTVDEPQISSLPPDTPVFTSEPAYVRLHGKNRAGWYKGASERYLYRYSSEELSEWLKKVRKLSMEADTVYVFFNNHPYGYAAINAAEFMRLLREHMPGSLANGLPPVVDQGRLF